jgi:hypothetical protein
MDTRTVLLGQNVADHIGVGLFVHSSKSHHKEVSRFKSLRHFRTCGGQIARFAFVDQSYALLLKAHV